MLPLIALLLGKGVISIRMLSRLPAIRLHQVLFRWQLLTLRFSRSCPLIWRR